MIIDILCGIVLIGGFILGFSRGIVSTFFGIISVIFGLIAAVRFGPFLSEALQDISGNDNGAWFFAGFTIAFVIVLLGLRFLAKAIEEFLESLSINFINQSIGGFITTAFFMLIFSVLVSFFDKAHLISDATKKESFVFPYTQDYPTLAYNAGMKVKPAVEKFWVQSIDVMDQLEDRAKDGKSTKKVIYDIEEEDEKGTKKTIIYDEELPEEK